MKLKNKISLLISSAIIISALTVALVYRSALKDALLKSHFLSEKRNLEMIAASLTAAIREAAESRSQPYHSSRQKNPEKKQPAPKISPTTIKGIVFEDVPYLIITAKEKNATRKIDFLYLWGRSLNPSVITQNNGRIYFITDDKGLLLAHPDEERVKARSDFSSLEAVKFSLKYNLNSGALITSDEKNIKTVAVWLRLALNNIGANTTTDKTPELMIFSFAPYEAVMLPSKQITAKATILILIISLILVGLGVLAAEKISRPLVRLATAAKKIGEGDLDFPLGDPDCATDKNPSSSDEARQLYSEFARMTVSLKNLIRMREDLVNMIIHDLKSPLSAVISSVEFLLADRENPPDEKQKKFLTIARNSSSNLMRLIEDMLDAARLEEGKMKIKISKDVPVKNIISDILKNFETQRIQEEKIFVLKCPDGLTADIDESLISRVITNIVSNAIRHTRRGEGVIEVEAAVISDDNAARKEEAGGLLKITISDNGEGIPKEYQDKIFDKFVSGQSKTAGASSKIARSGTGLGLTFSKMAVESHPGGKIFVESEVGRGTCFTILLPRRQKESA